MNDTNSTGQPVDVWQTNSDFSAPDAEILRESSASQNNPAQTPEGRSPGVVCSGLVSNPIL